MCFRNSSSTLIYLKSSKLGDSLLNILIAKNNNNNDMIVNTIKLNHCNSPLFNTASWMKVIGMNKGFNCITDKYFSGSIASE